VTQQVAALVATYGVKTIAKCGTLREQCTMAKGYVTRFQIGRGGH